MDSRASRYSVNVAMSLFVAVTAQHFEVDITFAADPLVSDVMNLDLFTARALHAFAAIAREKSFALR